jgi:hypothetical protein
MAWAGGDKCKPSERAFCKTWERGLQLRLFMVAILQKRRPADTGGISAAGRKVSATANTPTNSTPARRLPSWASFFGYNPLPMSVESTSVTRRSPACLNQFWPRRMIVWAAAIAIILIAGAAYARNEEDCRAAWAAADTNRDGFITRDEGARYHAALGAQEKSISEGNLSRGFHVSLPGPDCSTVPKPLRLYPLRGPTVSLKARRKNAFSPAVTVMCLHCRRMQMEFGEEPPSSMEPGSKSPLTTRATW